MTATLWIDKDRKGFGVYGDTPVLRNTGCWTLTVREGGFVKHYHWPEAATFAEAVRAARAIVGRGRFVQREGERPTWTFKSKAKVSC